MLKVTIPIKTPREEAITRAATGAHQTRRPWVLIVTILASSMAFIDGTVVNIALPALQTALHATVRDIQWVVEAYALLLASLLLLGGSLGDLQSRTREHQKRTLFGAHKVQPGAVSRHRSPPSSSPAACKASARRSLSPVALQSSVPRIRKTNVGEPSEPGLALRRSRRRSDRFLAAGSWRTAHGAGSLHQSSYSRDRSLVDPVACSRESKRWGEPNSRLGAALATIGLGAITYALIEAQAGGAAVWTSGVVGVCALGGFLAVETKSGAPMISLHLFRSRDSSGANLITALLYAPLSGILFFLPLDLIQVQHYSATQAGGALLPLILLLFALSGWSGGLVARYGARLPLTIGPLVAASGFALFLRSGNGGSYWSTFVPPVIILGLGMAISVAPLTTAVMGSVPLNEAGVASGLNNAISRIAGLLSVAVFGLILFAGFNRALDKSLAQMGLSPVLRESVDRERSKLAGLQTSDLRIRQAVDRAFLSGYRDVIWISVALAMLSALSAQMLKGTRPSGLSGDTASAK